jgi:hypothetical protein
MNLKHFVALASLAGLAALAAVFVVGARDSATSAAESGLLVEGLAERINSVAELSVTQGGSTLTVAKGTDGAWGLRERGGFPVQFAKVKQTLLTLADLERLEQKTSKPENFTQLELEEPDAPAAQSALVVVHDDQGAELAAVVVGKSAAGTAQAFYARKRGDDQCWLVKGRLDLRSDVLSWVEREIVKLESDRVKSTRVVHADGEELRLSRVEPVAGKWVIDNLPEGRQERSEGIGQSTATALSYFSLDDVKPVGEVDFAAEPLATAEYRTYDGLCLVVELAKQDAKLWARISARDKSPEQPPAPPPPGPPEDGADAPLAVESPQRDIAQESTELNARLTPWAFALPQWKADQIAKRMKDLLAEPPAPAAGGEAGAEEADTTVGSEETGATTPDASQDPGEAESAPPPPSTPILPPPQEPLDPPEPTTPPAHPDGGGGR